MATIQIHQRQLHYLDSGRGEVVLLGHSYLWDHRMWMPQIKRLSHRFRCIVPDLWGHGDSAPLDQAVSIDQLAEDHLRLMDSLGAERFAVVGLSVGGMWGTSLALAHPDRVSKLVVLDSYLGAEPPETQKIYFGLLDAVEQARCIPPAMFPKILPFFLSPASIEGQPDWVQMFQTSLSRFSPEQIHTIVALGRAIFSRPDRLDTLNRLQMPVLFGVGEQDRARPVNESQQMARLTPGSTLEIFPNAAHIATLEQPERVSEALLKFLSV